MAPPSMAAMGAAVAAHADVLRGRSMLVRKAEPLPVECVVRGYITGSAWKEYRDAGTLAGEPLPEGLIEAQELDPPIFSPATKAETGHDEPLTTQGMVDLVGEETAESETVALD